MRYAHYLAAIAATTMALPTSTISPQEEIFTIELEGGERRQVTETEKFALKAVCTYLLSLPIALNRDEPSFTISSQEQTSLT